MYTRGYDSTNYGGNGYSGRDPRYSSPRDDQYSRPIAALNTRPHSNLRFSQDRSATFDVLSDRRTHPQPLRRAYTENDHDLSRSTGRRSEHSFNLADLDAALASGNPQRSRRHRSRRKEDFEYERRSEGSASGGDDQAYQRSPEQSPRMASRRVVLDDSYEEYNEPNNIPAFLLNGQSGHGQELQAWPAYPGQMPAAFGPDDEALYEAPQTQPQLQTMATSPQAHQLQQYGGQAGVGGMYYQPQAMMPNLYMQTPQMPAPTPMVFSQPALPFPMPGMGQMQSPMQVQFAPNLSYAKTSITASDLPRHIGGSGPALMESSKVSIKLNGVPKLFFGDAIETYRTTAMYRDDYGKIQKKQVSFKGQFVRKRYKK